MKLAFCLFRYFPYGGVQRNFLRIAELCAQRGHEVHVFTMRWDGPAPPFQMRIRAVPVSGWTNHKRYEEFARKVRDTVGSEDFDLVVGFNKMPHLDVYYAGDPCFVETAHARRSVLYRMSPRYRHFHAFERAAFDRNANTRILLIGENQKPQFQKWYGTSDDRFFLLPPYVSEDRAQGPPRAEARAKLSEEFALAERDFILLMVGSDYRRKGVERSIRALASLPDGLRNTTDLLVVGNGRAWPYRALARRLGIADRVHLLGGRDDVPTFLAGSDLLLHPALEENTGTAIVEAIMAGLPVLTTDDCGYASHVVRAGAGRVVGTPFQQAEFSMMLSDMLASDERGAWREAALRYARDTDLTSRPKRAVELIETFGADRRGAASKSRKLLRSSQHA